MYTYIYMCVCIFTHIYVYVYIYMWIFIYKFTYIYGKAKTNGWHYFSLSSAHIFIYTYNQGHTSDIWNTHLHLCIHTTKNITRILKRQFAAREQNAGCVFSGGETPKKPKSTHHSSQRELAHLKDVVTLPVTTRHTNVKPNTTLACGSCGCVCMCVCARMCVCIYVLTHTPS